MAPSRKSGRWRVLAVTSVGLFLAFLDVTVVNIAFPDLERDFPAASRADLSWVLNAYNVVFAALLVPAGRLADRVGHRRVYLWGLVGFIAASALCAAAPGPALLVAARILQAAGAAAVIPASLALVLAEFPLERRATAVGLAGAVAALASGIGPSLAGVLVDTWTWRSVFAINLPVGALGLIAAHRVLRESRREPEARAPDVVGIALAAVAVGALALGIVQGDDWGWGSPRVLGAFAAAAALAIAFVGRSRHHPAPAVDLGLFAIRSFSAANAGTLLFAIAFFGGIFANVLFLTSAWGYSPVEAGLAVSPGPVISALVAGPAGRLADRFGQRVLIAPGVFVYAAGLVWFATQAGATPDFVARWLPGAALTGVGIGLAFPALASAAVAAVPATRFAVAAAVTASARQLGAVLGIALIVAVVGTPLPEDGPSAFDAGWILCAATALGAGAAGLAIGRASAAAGA